MKRKSGGLPPIIQFNQYNASTVSPAFITAAITPSLALEAKTLLVVLGESPRGPVAQVFRKSGKAKGKYSCDQYLWTGSDWKFQRKDKKKHDTPPFPPPGASHEQVAGVEVLTMHVLTLEDINRLRELIAVLKRS